MANYLTTDTELTNVANAIRSKTEISDNLVWPNDYITQINNLQKDPAAVLNNITIGSTLDNTSWSAISQVAETGLGDQIWDIGDCKKLF